MLEPEPPRGVTMGCLILRGGREDELYELEEPPRDVDVGGVKCCHEFPFSARLPCDCEGEENVPRGELSIVPRSFVPKPCPEWFVAPDCGGEKCCHPERPDCTDAVELAPLRLPPKPDSPRLALPEFPNEREPPVLLAVLLVREPPLKKCCEPELAPRIVDALAARPDGLKLSRDGVTGILPVIMLACRKESPLIRSWCEDTAPRPNSLPAIEETPPRTRSFDNASWTFEN